MRIEVFVRQEDAQPFIEYLQLEVQPYFDVIASVETVEVIQPNQFRLPQNGDVHAKAEEPEAELVH